MNHNGLKSFCHVYKFVFREVNFVVNFPSSFQWTWTTVSEHDSIGVYSLLIGHSVSFYHCAKGVRRTSPWYIYISLYTENIAMDFN